MTITEAIDYINAHTWSQWKLGLSRTEELLRLLAATTNQTELAAHADLLAADSSGEK